MTGFGALSDAERSLLMSRVRKTNTGPELIVRKLAFRLGYRFRLYYKKLPGTPDLAFPSRKRVIHVHGCFWHRHDCPAGRKVPGKNQAYWLPKFARIEERDIQNEAALDEIGWQSLVIWECETRDIDKLADRIDKFLSSD